MPAYSYEALNPQGQLCKGVVEADTVRSARSTLRSQTLIPLRVDQVGRRAQALLPGRAGDASASPGGSGWNRQLWVARAFNALTLSVWTRQLASLVGAGLPIERALSALSDETDNDRQRELMAALRSDVHGGATLAAALSQHRREFPAIYVSVVGAGEASGRLSLVLQKLADDLEEAQNLRAKLVGAALYPAIVTLVALVIVIFLLSYVVPQVAAVFAGSQRTLPWLTTALLSLSALVRNWGVVMLALLLLAALGLRTALQRPALRIRFDAGWLRLPLVGRLARHYNGARFAATLSMLVGAGVPILKSLQAAAETLSNQAMRADALDALARVRGGAPLGHSLAQKKRFPGLLGMFARLGEQAGELPLMLQRAANQLSGEVQRRALRLATLLEPLLIVAMGAAVMLIVLAVLLPIIELNQLVR
jgi:general secretion pathway protein F